jgi:hypothetical protein
MAPVLGRNWGIENRIQRLAPDNWAADDWAAENWAAENWGLKHGGTIHYFCSL